MANDTGTVANNQGAMYRHKYVSIASSFLYKMYLLLPSLMTSGYLPTTFDFEVCLTRDANNRTFMSATTDGHKPEGYYRLHISNYKPTLPIFEQNEQMRTAINQTQFLYSCF